MTKRRPIKIDANTKRDLYDKFSDYALDMSKLVFGGVILAGIMGLKIDKTILFVIGAFVVGLFALAAFVMIVLKHNNRR